MFKLLFSEEAAGILQDLEANPAHARKPKKIRKALGFLEVNPRHHGLQTHKYQSLHGPNGEEVFEAYVENNTPSAWRIWFWYGPNNGEITILTIGPHPD
jgi:hypothetical protein